MRDAHGRVQSVVLVGGTSEIGQAILRHLPIAPGGRVRLVGRPGPALGDAADAMAAHLGVEIAVGAFDACAPGDPSPLMDDWFDADVDVAIFAVGELGTGAIDDPVTVHRITEVNFAGVAPLIAACGEAMCRQGHGMVVVLSSIAAERPRADNAPYGAAKAGLDAFARGIAPRLEARGVRMLVVRPGFVHTRMTAGMRPAPFAASADDVAVAVAGALDGRASVIWVPGVLRWVMRVVTLLPERLFRVVAARSAPGRDDAPPAP
jgi:decaprenylphospho-beta-D-erythro-pentofuranosid-2-ulose 2-reductase